MSHTVLTASARSAATAALLALAVSACGSSADPAAAPSPSAPPTAAATHAGGCPVDSASATFTDQTGDMPEHYAENHAFQRRMDLCGEVLVQARAEQQRTTRALERLRVDGRIAAEEVRDALVGLGYPADALAVTDLHGRASFWVELNPFCLEGEVGSAAVEVDYAGVYYSEGIGCVRPEGGH